MFEQSLLQSAPAHRGRRGMATAVSFLLECTLIGLLVLLPLIYTEALPALHYAIDLGPPPSAPPPPPPVQVTTTTPSTSEVIGETVIAPIRIPTQVARVVEQVAPPPLNPGVSVPGGIGNDSHSAIVSVLSEHPYTPPPPPIPTVSRAPVSGGVMAGYLISQVQPVYPPLAQRVHVQGTVVLSAVISRDGRIENLRVLSGHPLLAPAAIEAVRQWRYRPYLLTGQPVEVETQVTVNFVLSPGS